MLSEHKCTEVHEAMTEPSGSKHTTSEQHVELGTSRKSRDFIDLVKIIQWLLTFNPFVLTNSNLRSLQSGLNSSKEKDGVNCEDAETIGANIPTKLANKAFNDIPFKKSNCVITLVALQKRVKCKNEIVHFDPLWLFSRLISIAERTKKFKEYFKCELTQEPTSLFKNGFMRESRKSDLKNILIENVHNYETYPTSKIVVNWGALLHQVSWNENCSCSEVIDQYCDYLQNNYGSCIVVFYGYGNGASTKDNEHRQRNKEMAFPYVKIELNMVAHNKQNDFFYQIIK